MSDMLSKIKKWLIDDSILKKDKAEKFIAFFKYYKKGDWVYPSILMKKLNITANES